MGLPVSTTGPVNRSSYVDDGTLLHKSEVGGRGRYSMVLTRRSLLQSTGVVSLTALAGCATTDVLGDDDTTTEYTLDIDPIDVSPTAYALYEPDGDALFGDPARTALEAILPDGRHTTYGYKPLPDDAYVRHRNAYFQTKHAVTGRDRLARSLVRVERVPEENVPDDAIPIDTLERPSARVLKVLHSYMQSDGRGSAAELLHGDSYVLRRPAERDSQLGTRDLDGRVVTMTESGTWAYRIAITTGQIVEPAYTVFAVQVASSHHAFGDVVFGSRIDAELASDDLPADAVDLLERTIDRRSTEESVPLSDSFVTLLEALKLRTVDTGENGRLLWYDGDLHRYGLYVNESP